MSVETRIEDVTEMTEIQVLQSVNSLPSEIGVPEGNGTLEEGLPITGFLPSISMDGQTNSCALYATQIPVSIASTLPEGTVLQISSDSTVLAMTAAQALQESDCKPVLNEQAVKDGNIVSLISAEQAHNVQNLSMVTSNHTDETLTASSVSLMPNTSLISITSTSAEQTKIDVLDTSSSIMEQTSVSLGVNNTITSSALADHTEAMSATSIVTVPIQTMAAATVLANTTEAMSTVPISPNQTNNIIPVSTIALTHSENVNVAAGLLDHADLYAPSSPVQNNSTNCLAEVADMSAVVSSTEQSSLSSAATLSVSCSNIPSGTETIGEIDFCSFLEQDDSHCSTVLPDVNHQIDSVVFTSDHEINNGRETAETANSQGSQSGNDDNNVVVIDVSKPIQLSQNSLIVVNGQKCVLQQDPSTGHVLAYPIKEPEKPKKKRGRPRKVTTESQQQDLQPDENASAEEDDFAADIDAFGKGLVEVTQDDGAIVRRSSRKRKLAQSLKDYETGNLKLELGSDDEDGDLEMEEDEEPSRKKGKGRGRPRKYLPQNTETSQLPFLQPPKRGRGRPRRYGVTKESTQAFLIQTAEGQSFMMQVPTASIPSGMTLQDVAQGIANSLNLSSSQPVTGPMSITLQTSSNENTSSNDSVQDSEPTLSPHPPLECSIDENSSESKEKTVQDEISTDKEESLDSTRSDLPIPLTQQQTQKQTPHKPPAIVMLTPAVPAVKKRGPGRPRKKPLPDDSPSKTSLQTEASESNAKDSSQTTPDSSSLVALQDSNVLSISQNSNSVTVSQSSNNLIISQTSNNLPVAISQNASNLATVVPVDNNLLPAILPPRSDSPVKLGLKASESELEKLVCPKCHFQAYYSQQYQEHLASHNLEAQHCKCCNFMCFQEEELINHYKEQHPKCICHLCNQMAEHAYIIKRHVMRHSDNGCTCDICGKTYKDHYILKMHLKMVHMPADVLYECDVCKKKFNRKAHLKRHRRTHDPDKPYGCDLCNYRGCERSDITKHILIHEEPRHTCDICGKTFRHIKNKDLHLKRHKGQRDYKCGVCDFYGYTFTDIRKHIERRHTDSKTIICTKCGQAFKTEALLNTHQASKQCEMFAMEHSLNEVEAAIIDVPRTEADLNENESNEQHVIIKSECNEEGKGISGVATIQLPDGSLATLNTITNEEGQIVISGIDASGILTQEGQLTIVSRPDTVGSEIAFFATEPNVNTTVNETQRVEVGDNDDTLVIVPTSSDNQDNIFLQPQAPVTQNDVMESVTQNDVLALNIISNETKKITFQATEDTVHIISS